MIGDRHLEGRVSDLLVDAAPSLAPDRLRHDIRSIARSSRQRPRWVALLKEPPMRLTSGLAVGSSTARAAALVAATILLLALATGAVVGASRLLSASEAIIVAQDGTGAFATITEAVAAAEHGDTILVRPGTYSGTVVIDKDITLRGEGPREEVVIEFTADSPIVQTEWAALPYGILLADTTATVSDLSVHGPNVAVAFVVVGGAPTIERVTSTLEGVVGDQPHSGVGLIHGASATIRGSTMDGPIWGLGGATLPGYEDLQGTGKVIVADSVIDSGISPPMIDGGSITGNIVTNGGMTITRSGTGTVEVSGNTATAISLAGTDGTGITVRDNDLQGSVEYGARITLGPGSPLIEGNDIRDMPVGIAVPDGATPTIRDNTIEDMQTGISVTGVSTAPVIEGNRFCDNDQDLAVPDGSTLVLDASNEVCPTQAPPPASG
jgi:nitrous oxidase accessory protein